MKVLNFIGIGLLFVFTTYGQVSLKLLEGNTSPTVQAALEAHKQQDEKAIIENYMQAVIEFKKYQTTIPKLSPEKKKEYIKNLLHFYHNAILLYLQSYQLEIIKKPIEDYINLGLKLSKQQEGKNGLLYAHFLSVAAYFYTKTHESDKAEALHLQALEIYKKQVGVSDIRYADEVSRLAYTYLQLGEPEKAEIRLLEIAPVFESYYKEDDWDYLGYLYDFVLVYMELRNYKQAIVYANRLMPLLKKITDTDTTPITLFLSELSILAGSLEYIGDLRMDKFLKKQGIIDSIRTNYPAVKINLDLNNPLNLAIFLHDPELEKNLEAINFLHKQSTNKTSCQPDADVQSRLDRIETILENRNKINESLSDNSLYLTTILLDQQIGNPAKANQYLTQMLNIQKAQIRKRIGFQTEAERENWWKKGSVVRLYTKLLIIYNYDNNHQLATHLQNLELFSKGMLLSSSQATRNAIFSAREPAVIDLWHQLLVLKANEKNNYQEIEQTEKKLMLASQKYLEEQEYLNIQWEDIRKSLKKDEAAIEFIDILLDDGLYYIVSVIRSDSEYPSLYPICYDKELREVLKNQDKKSNKEMLYETVWKPFEHLLQGGKTLYITPVGLLHNVSFNGIKKGGQYLCDEYKIHNLLSTKDVIGLKKKKENIRKNKRIALFGGADFELSAEELCRLDQNLKVDKSANLSRSLLDEISAKRSQGFSYLDGSRKEVQTISQQLIADGWKVALRMNKQATETRFKALSSSQSPKVIHISTHGFYFPEPPYDPMQIAQVMLMGGQQKNYRLSENLLMRSGLAFTGANHVWKGGDPPKDTDDGILTALEVAQMNLSNTELVVLSACKTGLGDPYGSEGVYGLQRAFRLAGVKTMIVSLWDISDKKTPDLMIDFYTRWASGLSMKDSFMQAQMELRHRYPDHPEVWAGFIMIE